MSAGDIRTSRVELNAHEAGNERLTPNRTVEGTSRDNRLAVAESQLDESTMITQRVLGILWMVVGALFGSMAVWRDRFAWKDVVEGQSLEGLSPWAYYFFLLIGPMLLFGAVAGLFLCRDARWARIGICVVGATTTVGCAWGIAKLRSFEFGEGVFGMFGLISVVLLCLPGTRKRCPTSQMQ
jgi:peptidoglycan/LPS O-acetylase OafA/YrhL